MGESTVREKGCAMATKDTQGAGGRQSQGEGQGAPDLEYDLISLVYHNLKGVEASGRYMSDAVEAGDAAIAEVFRQAQQSYLEHADQARQMLRERFGGAGSRRAPE
jgi:hypothetical protein